MNEYVNQYFKIIGYDNSCTENLLYKMQDDRRNAAWEEQREYCGGFDERVTWNLNKFIVEQLFTWLEMYLDNADGFVDLTFYKFDINGKEMTERQAILTVIDDLGFWLNWNDYGLGDAPEDCQAKLEEAFYILGKIFPVLWW